MTDFSAAQKLVLDCLSGTRESVLLTGVAGCGKSTLLRHYLELWRPDNTLVVAPTGIAAMNVGGCTVHRAFGLRPNTDLDYPQISLQTRSLLYRVETIIVDEVSMVRADILSAMDVVLKSVKRSQEPFGGVRMIFVGDFYQLPPVVRKEEERWMETKHGSRAGWCFFSPAFRALNPKVFYLGESFRQAGDGSFTSLLNAVRRLDPNVVNALNEIAKPAALAGDHIPRLCSTKNGVSYRNVEGLRKLGVPSIRVDPVLSGDISKIPDDEKAPVILAEGARVMCRRNGSGYVNGSLGTLRSFDAQAVLWDGSMVPAMQVQLDSGSYVNVPREKSEVFGYEVDHETGKPTKVEIASVQQYPLQLAYAWTVHKSQGQTLEAAVIDLGRGAFAHGQTYVALSRLTSAAGLYLSQPLTRSDLLLDPDVVHFFGQYIV